MIKVTKDNIDEVTKEGIVAIHFWASWCKHCRLSLLRFTKTDILLNETTVYGLDNALFGAINLDDTTPDLLEQHKVPAVPCTVFYKDGKVMESVLGLQEVDYFVDKIKGIL